MDAAIAKHIIAASEVIGCELNLKKDYIGRGMRDSSTYAITGSENEFRQAICYAAGTIADQPPNPEDPEDLFDLDQFCEAMSSLKTDNMGRYDLVWY